MPDWDAVIVDDGSTDATGTLADGFAHHDARIRVVHQANGGEAAAAAGLMVARHEWILFLDADDYIAPMYLERMRDALAANPDLDAVHCGWARIAADGTQVVDRYEPPTGDMFDVWAQRSAFPVHACIVRASRIADVGTFDISLRKSADWDLWQRIARTGAQFGTVREVLAFYRMGPSSASLDASVMLEDGLRVMRRGHGPDPRVAHPDPRHVNGRDPALMPSQAFYLMCWCGGLLIGRDEDARPLLGQLAGMRFPALYPPAVAQCIFDSAPLPSCAPPAKWETLWPRVHQRVDDLLVAVEEHAGAPGLAAEARLALMRMSLANSSSWRPGVTRTTRGRPDKRSTISQQQATTPTGSGDRTAPGQDHRISRQRSNCAIVDQVEAYLHDVQRLAEERAQALETSAAGISELERAVAILARDRDDWRQLSEDRTRALELSATLVRELEGLTGRLRDELAESERLSDERAMLLADLRSRPWVSLGFRLRLLKPSPEMDVADHGSAAGQAGHWQLALSPGYDAHLMSAPGERESVRVVIATARSKDRWDIQFNRPGLRVMAQRRYAVHFRARADRPRKIARRRCPGARALGRTRLVSRHSPDARVGGVSRRVYRHGG